jgi:hypothetical protein
MERQHALEGLAIVDHGDELAELRAVIAIHGDPHDWDVEDDVVGDEVREVGVAASAGGSAVAAELWE